MLILFTIIDISIRYAWELIGILDENINWIKFRENKIRKAN